MDKSKRIWVLGASSVGSVMAAVLGEQAETFLIGDSPHAQAVKRDGLIISQYGEKAEKKNITVDRYRHIPKINDGDLVLLTGKIWGLKKAVTALFEKLSPSTPVVAFQNGMGFEKELERGLGKKISRAIVKFGSNSDGEGSVVYYPGKIVMLSDNTGKKMHQYLDESPIRCELTDDLTYELWHKLLINCIANSLAGLLKINNQSIADHSLDDAKNLILQEVKMTAKLEGVQLSITLDDLNGYFQSENIPSLVRDLERGEKTEIKWINGYIVDRAKHHGIAAPVNQTLTTLIEFLSQKQQNKRRG